ncbi:hypothetical protein [Limihaloglobus sulfuriphilus]|uniref:hypothetical protein n=1 Tax=Limihaloglobus sulfuriphilus TaxID=1851148 RepID=UPI0011BA8DE3|nr:hypothetical protein [Limihaloglobus sulfuriphilus]
MRRNILNTAFSYESGAGSAPGNWALSPETLVSGRKTRVELCYEHTGLGLPAGSYHRVLIEPVSVKSLFHCPPSTDMKVVEYKNTLPKVDLIPQAVHGVGFREVKMVFPEGIKRGDSFAVQLGNTDDKGEITALINPVPVSNLTFEIYTGFDETHAAKASDKNTYKQPWNPPQAGKEYDWQVKGWAYALPKINIKPAPASALRIFAPSLVKAGSKFDMRISVTDEFDSRAFPVFEGNAIIEDSTGFEGASKTLKFSKKDRCSKLLKNISITKPGIYRLRARLDGAKEIFESNPVIVRNDVKAPIYWGNIHNHGQYSECWGDDLDTFYSFAREVSGMDYVSLSDHLGAMPRKQGGAGRLLRWRLGHPVSPYESWKDTITAANRYNSDDFVTLIGYEWSSMDMGHYNIYLAEADMDNMDKIFTDKYEDCGFTLQEKLKNCEALFIPHKHADVFPYRPLQEVSNSAGKALTPCIEVYSDWGDAFDPYGRWPEHSLFGGVRNSDAHSYLWALEKGYRLGVLGDSDSHTGLPGRRNPGGVAPHHDHPQGLTAVMTNNFSRQGVMDAFHDRAAYATTGERIFLDVRALGVSFGEILRCDENFSIEVEAAGTDLIESVNLFNGMNLVESKKFGNVKDIKCTFGGLEPAETMRAYTVAVIQKDENRAYSSPIWVVKKSLPELSVERTAGGEVFVVNNGSAAAENVEIMLSRTDFTHTRQRIPGREPAWEETAGFIWTTRRDDRNIILHYRWHGEPIEGSVEIAGAADYEFDYNRDFIFWQGQMTDHGDGKADFTIGKTHTITHSIGFDIDINVRTDVPCKVTISFNKDLTTFAGSKTFESDKITVPLNGRTNNAAVHNEKIPVLEPGRRWKVPTAYKDGYVSFM